MLYDTFRKKHYIIYYHVEPWHEHHIISSHYITDEPEKYASHSDESHSSQRKNYYSGHNIYEAVNNTIVQNISEAAAKWYQKATSDT
jgi:hypothetical protein